MLVQEASSRLTARQAAELLGVSRGLIELWAKAGKCPFLDEPFQVFRNPQSRKGVLYDAKQIARIKEARAVIQQAKGKSNGYLSYPEVRKRFAWKQRQLQQLLYDWHDKGCGYLGGQKLDAHKEMRPVDKGNGLREAWVYNLEQLERIDNNLKEVESGVFKDQRGTWLSAKKAFEEYKIWEASLEDWQEKACPFLRRKIACLRQRRHGDSHQFRWMYLQSDLQAIYEAQRAERPEPTYQDAEGTWIFASGVARRTGWPQDGLWYYRTKSWPCFVNRPSGRLRAKQVSSILHPGITGPMSSGLVWAYHKDDIEILAGLREVDEPAPAPVEQVNGRRGRRRSDRTRELYQFCYEQLASRTKRSIICRRAQEQFDGFSMVESDVTTYARRYAQRENKPWPV